jgi:hypothetical protein
MQGRADLRRRRHCLGAYVTGPRNGRAEGRQGGTPLLGGGGWLRVPLAAAERVA